MSNIQRFWCHDAQNIRCVRESDYDAAQAELEALREELAIIEQRNTTFASALQEIASIEDELHGGDWDEIEKARDIANEALKPTESGASE